MIVDGRKSQWNVVKTVVLMLQVILFFTIMKWLYFTATDMVIMANIFYLLDRAQTSQWSSEMHSSMLAPKHQDSRWSYIYF